MTVPEAAAAPSRVRGLYVETWGDGAPVVLVHGSLAIGPEEWEAQRPLADEGFRLIVFDRRGYGQSEEAEGEDFLIDADDIVELMGDGAHLVGHSYGGLGVMIAAARRPEATRSLTVLESPVAAVGQHEEAWRQLVVDIDELWGADLSDEEWVVRFLTAVGAGVPARSAVHHGSRPAGRAGGRGVPQARRLRRPPRRVRRDVRRAGPAHRREARRRRRCGARDPVHRRPDQRAAAGAVAPGRLTATSTTTTTELRDSATRRP